MGYLNIREVGISPEQVRLARQVIADVAESNVLEWLEAHSSTFYLITVLDLIEHFQKPEVLRFLDGCHGALKPGGRLILQTPNADSPLGNVLSYGVFSQEVDLNPNALSRLVRLSGLQKVEAREQGPVPLGYSAVSSVRYLTWQTIRVGLKAWNLVKTGAAESGVFTRVFLISGTR